MLTAEEPERCLFREAELAEESHVHFLHIAAADGFLAGWRQHKDLNSDLRIARDRLE